MRRGEKETGLEMRKNHRALLQTIWAWALITILSIIYVPWNIETEIAPQHGLEQQLSSREAARPSMAREATVNRTTLELSPKDETNVIGNDDFNATYHQLPAKYHTVFSTGCSLYQDWQSYIFFYSALQSGQEGHITRIASGCEGKNKSELEFIFQNEIAPMDPERLHLHQTPEYGYIHKRKIPFKYFNKPYGLRHWFENVLGYPENHAEHDDSIIILMDPDQILLRPFTDDFTNSSEVWRLPEEGRHKLKVEHGSPFSQNYGYDIEWLWVANKRKVFRRRRTPISKMSDEELMDYYKGMGAPYIATAKDMYEIVKKWTKIVPRVRDEWPNILSEMFAYNWAIAHLKLRHTIAYSFMVSEVGKGGEGWSLVDTVDGKDVCHNYPKSKYVSRDPSPVFFPCRNFSRYHV